MPEFDLVIFDCDGVLIDSEVLSASVFIEEIEKNDIHMEQHVFFERMVGRSFEQGILTIREETGKKPPPNFKEAVRHALLERFTQALQPIKDIATLLQALNTSVCVATSSDSLRAARSLAITGLDGFFTDRVFTASMVKNGKPAPDLFLHAASQLNTKAERCIVIEDSAYGLIAATAAGMTAWHFNGGSHFSHGYSVNPEIMRHRTFSNMAALLVEAKALSLA
jgi:HAD superfamily hydrolase (TIGR01509 family)